MDGLQLRNVPLDYSDIFLAVSPARRESPLGRPGGRLPLARVHPHRLAFGVLDFLILPEALSLRAERNTRLRRPPRHLSVVRAKDKGRASVRLP
jgi:hypothetical protein